MTAATAPSGDRTPAPTDLGCCEPPSLEPCESMEWVDFSGTGNPLGAPPSFADAVRTFLERDKEKQPAARDLPKLRADIGGYFGLGADSIYCGSTLSDMLLFAMRAFAPCTAGITTPGPAEYEQAATLAGHRAVSIENPAGFVVPDPGMAARASGPFDAAVLANPCYPTSRLLPRRTLLRYLDQCAWVVVDERSIELSLGGESMVPLVREHENLIVIRSLSESFSIQGVPITYCAAHPATIERMAKACSEKPGVSLLAQTIVEHALGELSHLERARELLDAEIPWLQCMLSLTPGISIYPAEANFVLCCYRCKESMELGAQDVDDLAEKLQREGFLIRRLKDMPGLSGDGYFTATVRSRRDNERFIAALRRVLGCS